MEHIFEFLRPPEEEKVIYAIYMLRKGARLWWDLERRLEPN